MHVVKYVSTIALWEDLRDSINDAPVIPLTRRGRRVASYRHDMLLWDLPHNTYQIKPHLKNTQMTLESNFR